MTNQNGTRSTSLQEPDCSRCMITQRMIKRIAILRDAQKRYDELRLRILRLFAAGARIEAGDYEIEVEITSYPRLSAKALRKVFTPEEIEWLKAAVDPSASRHLIIKQRTTGRRRRRRMNELEGM